MRIDSLQDVYCRCTSEGRLKEKNQIDIELIKSLKDISEMGMQFSKKNLQGLPKDSQDWTFIFRNHYEALRGLVEAFLLFDNISSDNHQCNNAYLCHHHPELEFDWEFLETIRLIRNMMNYRGRLVTYENFKSFELQIDLYFSTLKKNIEEKLKQ